MASSERSSVLVAGPPAPAPSRLWPTFVEALVEVWQSRELLVQLTLRDIRIRYKQAVMGFGWAVLMPIMVVGAAFIVRLALHSAGVTQGGTGFGAMAAKGIAWSFFSGAIGFATSSLTANMNLVAKVYFPREVLPLSAVGAQGFDTMIAVVALSIALPFLGVPLSLDLLWLPVLALLLLVLTGASALFLSCANLFFRDVKYIVQILLTFGIFVTPVLIEPSMLGATGSKLMMLNPLAPILEGIRLVLGGHGLLQPIHEAAANGTILLVWEPWYLLYSALLALGGFVVSLLVFHRLEFTFAEYL